MKNTIWIGVFALGLALAAPAGAQINIETEGKNVSIGPNGIFVQKGGKTVSLKASPNRVSVKKTVTKAKPVALPGAASQVQVQANPVQVRTTSPTAVLNIEPIVLNDNKIDATMPMTMSKALIVNGNKCTITLTGSAAGVIVNGNSNTITCDAVNLVEVHGNQNIVTWKKGVSTANPSVVNLGNENHVSHH